MEQQKEKKLKGLSWRALLLGILLIPINTYWVTVIEVRWYSLDGTSLPLFITPIFILFVLCLLNLLARRLKPRLGLDRAELTTVYVMIVVSCTLAGHDMVQNLFGLISHPYYFASPANNYHGLFFRYLPKFLLVRDMEALRNFYSGNVSPWSTGFWRAWAQPLTLWGVFLAVLFAMMLAANSLLRRAWTENEKLVFPLVQLPTAMAAGADGHGLFRTPALWYGFALAGGITLLNGIHVLYPQTPYLAAVKLYDLSSWFPNSPWNAMTPARISMYPFAIGIAFFVPLDLSFSCWFFFVARMLFQALGRMEGWDAAGVGFPYFPDQGAGAWLGLGVVIVLGARKYLAEVWQVAFCGRAEQSSGDRREYRMAFITIAAGMVFLAYWSALLNMKAWVAALFFGIYLLLSLTITRVRAELGAPHEIFYVNPQSILTSLFGTTALGPHTMTAICTMYWFNRCMRCHPMPNQMESFRMSASARVNHRSMIVAMVVAFVVGLGATYWANLQVTYTAGAAAKAATGFKWWLGTEAFSDRLASWMTTPRHPQAINIYYFAGGFLLVMALRLCRGAWVAWPFHPAGYALAVSYAMDYFWFAFFISWALKSVIVRYGGMRLHNRAVPFFLGLILGDFVMGSIWAIIGPVLGIPTYRMYI